MRLSPAARPATTINSVLLSALVAALLPSRGRCFEVTLDEPLLQTIYTSVKLSDLAYVEDTSVYSTGNGTFAHPDYEEISFYTEEPASIRVCTQNSAGRCLGS